jgi:hypothetical protein
MRYGFSVVFGTVDGGVLNRRFHRLAQIGKIASEDVGLESALIF